MRIEVEPIPDKAETAASSRPNSNAAAIALPKPLARLQSTIPDRKLYGSTGKMEPDIVPTWSRSASQLLRWRALVQYRVHGHAAWRMELPLITWTKIHSRTRSQENCSPALLSLSLNDTPAHHRKIGCVAQCWHLGLCVFVNVALFRTKSGRTTTKSTPHTLLIQSRRATLNAPNHADSYLGRGSLLGRLPAGFHLVPSIKTEGFPSGVVAHHFFHPTVRCL